MDLNAHYTKLYNDSVAKILAGDYVLDPMVDSSSDGRRGITLIIRPDAGVREEIRKFQEAIQAVEPRQYYYPVSDMHITVMSIISCYEGFDLSRIDMEEYRRVIQESIEGLEFFEIEFRGVTASSSCVMIQGFPSDNTLLELRDKLRLNFSKSDLEQSLDLRYSILTAHTTVVRLRKDLLDPAAFLKAIESWRNHSFGTFPVTELELVYNDWFMRKEVVKSFGQFYLTEGF